MAADDTIHLVKVYEPEGILADIPAGVLERESCKPFIPQNDQEELFLKEQYLDLDKAQEFIEHELFSVEG